MLRKIGVKYARLINDGRPVGRGGFEGFARTPLLASKRFYILSALPLESGPLVVSLLLRITAVQASLVATMQVCS